MKRLIFCLVVVFFTDLLGVGGVAPALWAQDKKAKAPHPQKEQSVLKEFWGKGLKGGGSKKKFFPEMASPIVAGNHVLVGTHSGEFYALDVTHKGNAAWTFKSTGPIASQAVADGQRVYFGNNKGTVYAIDQNTGKAVWEHFVGGEILAAPALQGGDLYVVTTSREVYSLKAETGDENWSTYVRGFEKRFTMRGTSPLVVSGGLVYVSFADGQIVSLSRGNGSIAWSTNLAKDTASFKDVDASVLLDGGYLYAVGYYGMLTKMEAKSGRVIWDQAIQSGTDIAFDGQYLYVSGTDGKVVAFSKETGYRRWEQNLHAGVLSAPLLTGNYLLVGSQNGRGFVFQKDSGKVVQSFSVGSGFLGNAVESDGRVFFLTGGAQLKAMEFSSSAKSS